MSKLEAKRKELQLMTQRCNLLDQELKRESLLESIDRVDENILAIKERIEKIENDVAIEGEEQ